MPYRTFEDSKGAEWQVWDIVPHLSERRTSDRRVETAAVEFADRRSQDRRLTRARRAVLTGAYANGWLCFESEVEKRRLTPIPPDWTTCADDRLEEYSRRAQRVPASPQLQDDPLHEPFAEAG